MNWDLKPTTIFVLLLAISACAESTQDKPATNTPSVPAGQSSSLVDHGKEHAASALGFDYSSDAKNALALGIPSAAISAHYHALPDYLLEARAKSGDDFAKTFLTERIATKILSLQRARRTDGSLPPGTNEDAMRDFGQMSVTLSALMQNPTNAMAGYLWGLAHSASILGGPDEPIVAGIRLAGLRGDSRAVEFERKFRESHPNLNEAYVEMYFESGRREMEMAAIPRGP